MNFWWHLRRFWHHPHAYRMIAYEKFALPYRWSWRTRTAFLAALQHDLWLLPQRIWRRVMIVWSYGPLACNGGRPKGKWRYSVEFCDWLEERARRLDEKFYPEEKD